MNPKNDKDLFELESELRELAAHDRMRMDDAMTARLCDSLRNEMQHAQSVRRYRRLLAAAALVALFCVFGLALELGPGGGSTEQPLAATEGTTQVQQTGLAATEGGNEATDLADEVDEFAHDLAAFAKAEDAAGARAIPLGELGSAEAEGYSPEPNLQYLSRAGLEFGIAMPGAFELDAYPVAL